MNTGQETVAPAEFERAIEVFARGFSFARSFTHPYVPERLAPNGARSAAGTLWVLRDADRRTGAYRKEEWVSHGLDPEYLHAAVANSPWRERTRACRSTQDRGGYSVCAIHATEEPDRPLRDGFKSLGYRLGGTEPFMLHRLRRIPRVTAPAVIRRVRTEALADRLAKAARARQILPEHLGDGAPQRQYVAMARDAIVGWVGSIAVGDATWCQNMYVPRHRPRHAVPAAARRPRGRDGAGRAACLPHRRQAVCLGGLFADRHAAVLYAEPEVRAGLSRSAEGPVSPACRRWSGIPASRHADC